MSKLSEDSRLHIATLGKSIGLRGDMKLHLFTDFPEQFKKSATFLLQNGERITIERIDLQRKRVKLLGVDTIEDAKRFTNRKIFTTVSDTRANITLEEGEHFWFDIIGVRVFEEGVSLGVVEEMDRIATTTYLQIRTDDALVQAGEAKRFLLPYEARHIEKKAIEEGILHVKGALDILRAS